MIPMAYVAFDTLKFVEKLIVAGMPAEQAKAFSELQKEVFEEALEGTLATKTDIQVLKAELKTEIQELRTELKTDIQELRVELKSDIQQLRTETKTEIAEVKSDVRLLKWMMGFLLTGVGVLILKAFF